MQEERLELESLRAEARFQASEKQELAMLRDRLAKTEERSVSSASLQESLRSSEAEVSRLKGLMAEQSRGLMNLRTRDAGAQRLQELRDQVMGLDREIPGVRELQRQIVRAKADEEPKPSNISGSDMRRTMPELPSLRDSNNSSMAGDSLFLSQRHLASPEPSFRGISDDILNYKPPSTPDDRRVLMEKSNTASPPQARSSPAVAATRAEAPKAAYSERTLSSSYDSASSRMPHPRQDGLLSTGMTPSMYLKARLGSTEWKKPDGSAANKSLASSAPPVGGYGGGGGGQNGFQHAPTLEGDDTGDYSQERMAMFAQHQQEMLGQYPSEFSGGQEEEGQAEWEVTLGGMELAADGSIHTVRGGLPMVAEDEVDEYGNLRAGESMRLSL